MTTGGWVPLDLTQDLPDKLRSSPAESLDEIMRRGLDWLARLAPYDLATIFWLESGRRLTVRSARGRLAYDEIKDHELSLDDFPTIREALETRRARAFTETDHRHGDGDPFDGILDLPPGHACMVVPLCAGDTCFGVLTLDRAYCEPYPEPTVQLVEVYGQVLALAIQNAISAQSLERLHRQDHEHAKALEAELAGATEEAFGSSKSPAMREVLRRAELVAATDTPVLIRGETGTGKERLSWAIHRGSKRADQPFVRVNCAAIPGTLLEAELFGHVKGAYTGATKDRAGRFQLANGGTILLDEIGELPLELQAKLLRVLQEGTLEPVGSDRTIKIDVRVLAATHVDLERAIAHKRFREDLYYRLNVFPLVLPPLRERLEDLPKLSQVILDEQARRTGRKGMKVSRRALEKLAAYSWPGNLRELANVLERATILATGRELEPEMLHLDLGPALARQDHSEARTEPTLPVHGGGKLGTLEEVQAEHIRRVLSETGGKIYGEGGAAEILGLKPSTLQSKMKKLGLSRK